jgi:hypothetical protein
MGAAIRAREFRRSASLTWDCEGFETDNLARQSAGMRRAAMMTHDSTMHGERNDDVEVCADDFPSSCPRLSRASTPCLPLRKAWMAGTSPAMTNDGFWRNEPERCSKWRFGETTPSSRSGETNPRGLRSGILAKRTRGLRRPNGLENVQNDRKIRVLSSRQWRRLRRVATTVLWLRLPYLRDCRRKGMPPGDKHRRNIMGSGP